MDCRTTRVKLNRDKSIGRVLFIVEGQRTEHFILKRIFSDIMQYSYLYVRRDGKKPYMKLQSSSNVNSKVFVINAEESNICFIDGKRKFLDDMFTALINDYEMNFENAAIYYLWDRDHDSNDVSLTEELIRSLGNSRDSGSFERQGMLLLSYPCVEAYVASCFPDKIGVAFDLYSDKGKNFKPLLSSKNANHQDINDIAIMTAATQMLGALVQMGVDDPDLDDICEASGAVLNWQESVYNEKNAYRLFSQLSIALLDLGILEVE